jgi:hypothetical protein
VGASSTCVDESGPSIHGCYGSLTINGGHLLEDPSLKMALPRSAALNITFSNTLLKGIKELIILSSDLYLISITID